MNLVRNIKRRTDLRDPEDAQLRYTIYLERIRSEVKSASRDWKGEMVREKEANELRGNFQELRNNSCARNRLRIASETKDGPSPRNDQRRRGKERKTQRERAKDTERKSSVLPQLNVLRTFCRPLTSQGPVFPVVLPPHYSLAIFVLASRAARSRCCFAFRTPPANIFIKHTPTLPASPPSLSPPPLSPTGVKYSSGVVVVGSASRNERESPKNLFPAKSSFSLSIRASGGWDGSRHGDDIAGKTAG